MFQKAGMVPRRALRTAHHSVPGHSASDLVQMVKHRQQQYVVCRLSNRTVELIVLRLVVWPVCCGHGPVTCDLQPRYRVFGRVDRRLARNGRFQRSACAHQLYRGHLFAELGKTALPVFHSMGGHKRAFAHVTPNRTVTFQRFKRTPKHIAADPEADNQLAFRRQPIARIVPAITDEIRQSGNRICLVKSLELAQFWFRFG